MVTIGYTLMGEQRSPSDLVADAAMAERAGFAFSVTSDHYHPWLEAQGHSPYTWSVLGAIAQATDQMQLMTYVTCPIIRYHPAVVAQKAATVALLSGGRFTLGVGAGEQLNEHVVGAGWPSADVRHEMLAEAVDVIRGLMTGQYVNYRGRHYTVDSGKLFDLPDSPPPIGIALSGPDSCDLAGKKADLAISTEPDPELLRMFAEAGGAGKPAVAQLPVCWGPDEAKCRELAVEQFSWSALGWKVMSELPNPVNFQAATRFVRGEDLAESIPCGHDVDAVVQGVRQFADAGFTHVALVQIGDGQQELCDAYTGHLGQALSEL